MLVQIVGLSVVLVATLIILFVCISGNINLKMEVDKLKRQNDSLRFNIICVCEENKRLAIKLKKPQIITPSLDIKEAVHYAMIKAHPDNGGKQEDFVKFRKLYERMNNEYR